MKNAAYLFLLGVVVSGCSLIVNPEPGTEDLQLDASGSELSPDSGAPSDGGFAEDGGDSGIAADLARVDGGSSDLGVSGSDVAVSDDSGGLDLGTPDSGSTGNDSGAGDVGTQDGGGPPEGCLSDGDCPALQTCEQFSCTFDPHQLICQFSCPEGMTTIWIDFLSGGTRSQNCRNLFEVSSLEVCHDGVAGFLFSVSNGDQSQWGDPTDVGVICNNPNFSIIVPEDVGNSNHPTLEVFFGECH